MDEPLSDDRWAELQWKLEQLRDAREYGKMNTYDLAGALPDDNDYSDLIGEISRLRAENAAMRPIVEAVANIETYALARCPACRGWDMMSISGETHYDGCPIIAARGLLAKETQG